MIIRINLFLIEYDYTQSGQISYVEIYEIVT